MYLGTYLVSITAGKRISIPTIFREDLGKELILSQWYEKCLVLTGKSSLNTLLSRITGGSTTIIEPVRKTEHFIFASSFDVVPDEQGRIVIPDKLFDYAGLKEQVYVLGVGDRVEIWDKQTWEQAEAEVAEDAANYIEELAKRNG